MRKGLWILFSLISFGSNSPSLGANFLGEAKPDTLLLAARSGSFKTSEELVQAVEAKEVEGLEKTVLIGASKNISALSGQIRVVLAEMFSAMKENHPDQYKERGCTR